MRNLFDQYQQPENRLTHALLCSLDADRELLRSFLAWIGEGRRKSATLIAQGQSLPGEPEAAEDEADRKGIPDGCISDGEGWAVLIESKLVTRWNEGQLRRHRNTAPYHGLEKPVILCITSGRSRQTVPDSCLARAWPEVYAWLHSLAGQSEWARRCRGLFRGDRGAAAASGSLARRSDHNVQRHAVR